MCRSKPRVLHFATKICHLMTGSRRRVLDPITADYYNIFTILKALSTVGWVLTVGDQQALEPLCGHLPGSSVPACVGCPGDPGGGVGNSAQEHSPPTQKAAVRILTKLRCQ
jgi:hypothetical protein